jgi:hypothetical protein
MVKDQEVGDKATRASMPRSCDRDLESDARPPVRLPSCSIIQWYPARSDIGLFFISNYASSDHMSAS